MMKLCYFAVRDDNGCVSVKGYGSDVTMVRFFTDIAKTLAFEDCTGVSVVFIVWQGSSVVYEGWRSGMLFRFLSPHGNTVIWEGCFPMWNH